MKNFKLLSLTIIALLIATLAIADSLTLTTYYPAPFGIYDQIRLVPRGDEPCTADNEGLLYVREGAANEPHTLEFCDGGVGGSETAGAWEESFVSTDADADFEEVHIYPSSEIVGTTDAFIGIGTQTPEFKLHLGTDGGILAQAAGTGDNTQGTQLTATNLGASMLWYPRKAAFRAGYAVGADWNDASIGNYSVALGNDVLASGENAIALGEGMNVGGANSVGINLHGSTTYSVNTPNTMSIMGGNLGVNIQIPTERVHVNNGSVMVDSIGQGFVFGSTSNGMTYSATNQLSLSTVGLERLRVEADGQSYFDYNVHFGENGTGFPLFYAPPRIMLEAGAGGFAGSSNGFENYNQTLNFLTSAPTGQASEVAMYVYNEATTVSELDAMTLRVLGSVRSNRYCPTGATANCLEMASDGRVGVGQVPAAGIELDVLGDIEASGNITANAFVYSDKKLKKDIKPISSALDKIAMLEGVEFKWKETGKKNIGVIAQDIEKVFPTEVFEKESNGNKVVNYASLVAPLIEAVKEQKEIVEKQKEAMDEQDEKIKMLEKKLAELEKMIEKMGK